MNDEKMVKNDEILVTYVRHDNMQFKILRRTCNK